MLIVIWMLSQHVFPASTYAGLSTTISFAPSQWPHLSRRVENLTGNPLKYQPAVNQVELNFWNPQPALLEVRFVVFRRRFQAPYLFTSSSGRRRMAFCWRHTRHSVVANKSESHLLFRRYVRLTRFNICGFSNTAYSR